MLSANRTLIGERISTVTQQLIFLALNVAADIDKEEKQLSDITIEPPLVELLSYLVMWYQKDTEGLLKKYRQDSLWKAAIRKQFGMDDPDEKGYWYYHVYKEEPTVLFSVYFEEHAAIALEKLLETFEHGWHKEYEMLRLDLKGLVDEKTLTYAIGEVLGIIDERIENNRMVHEKETARFVGYLYSLAPKNVESWIQSYEASVVRGKQLFAEQYRYTMQHENPQQTELVLA